LVQGVSVVGNFSCKSSKPFHSFLGFAGSKKKEKRFVFDLARGDLGDLEGAKRFDFQ
jgi:hypothetical protein